MRVFSLCAGQQIKFSVEEFPMPKQTISVGDEMLIERQTRQVRERGHVLSVVGNNKILLSLVENFGYHFFVPLKRRFTVETFYSTREVWKGRTIILLGDVFYTENTMDRIFEIGYPITFFGDAQEVYAVTFDQRSKMKKHLHRTIRDAEFGKCKGTLRNLFSNLTGTEYKEGIRTAVKWWVAVNDLTCDFDLPRDLLKARLRGDLIKKGELI